MQEMPVAMPLSRTASFTSPVMSRTASPPAVRSSVSRWKTFTAPILRVRPSYVTGEPSERSVPGPAAGGGLAHLAFVCGGAAAAGGAPHHDRPLHPLILVPVDGAVHLVRAGLGERDPERHRRARADLLRLLLHA